MHKPEVAGFCDARTGSIQHVIACPYTRKCAIIDPVFDFDEKSGSTATTNADVILDYIDHHDPAFSRKILQVGVSTGQLLSKPQLPSKSLHSHD